jgi:hypothetical protein
LSQEIVPHARVGDYVTFSLPAAPLTLSLQAFASKSQRWQNILTSRNPRSSLSQLAIPQQWRQADLRIVASYRTDSPRRKRIASRTDQTARTVTFTSTPQARLFSVEYRETTASPWSRVCTVAASASPRAVSVSLPGSVPRDSEIRVMAVSGPRSSPPSLQTPLSEQMRSGPVSFAPSVRAVSEVPVFAFSGSGSLGVLASPSAGDGGSARTPAPEESDIWKTRGNKIYFFNRLRGLQVIDVSDPAEPLMPGRLPLPGAGEEMYLLGKESAGADAALLVTGVPWSPSEPEATRLHRIALADDLPVVETSLELPGYYVESRLAGGLLHVVTASWISAEGNWSPRTFVTTVEVAQGGQLVALPPQEFAGLPHAVGSTAKYFWFASSPSGSWSDHELFVFPYAADNSLAGPLRTDVGGRVQDKFKVGDTSDGLAVVVQNWSEWQQVTSLETYGEEEAALASRGKLELVRGEQLFATRFDRDRLYAVTFQQVDPLWIVDLSDPAAPAIKGHLEVPGWSTFIQPVGDTLVAVGRDGGKVQVSLFDVSDESKPVLAERIDVGSGWSWSEAEWNEKAVKILPDAGLIVIPVVEWNGGTRSNRVGLLDFDAATRSMSIRGTIDHDFAPRRAALMDGGLLASVSNRELLLVDAADRGNPAVVSETALAFGVDRLVVRGDTAIMFENGGHEWSGSPRDAMLRTAAVGDTEDVAFETPLPCARVQAAEVLGDRLVVVESSRPELFWALAAKALPQASSEPATGCALSVWSLQDAARPALLGRVSLPLQAGEDIEILPAPAGRVVVVGKQRGRNFLIRPLPVPAAASVAAADLRMSLPWLGWGNNSMALAVVDVSGETPVPVGSWNLPGDDIVGISDVFAAGDLLAFSYEQRDAITAATRGLPWPADWSGWRTRTWLQILDLARPEAPMPWAPVELPGELLGVSWLQRAGGVLFARSGGDRVAALGFDGENAAVAAEIDAPSVAAVEGPSLYFPAEDGVSEWNFSEASQSWQRAPGWLFEAGGNIGELHVRDGALLAGNWRQAWVLREDGSVSAGDLPAGAQLGSAVNVAGGFILPAGEYGVVPLR